MISENGNGESLLDLVENLENPDPEFKFWITRSVADGQEDGVMLLVKALCRHYDSNNLSEGIAHLHGIAIHDPVGNDKTLPVTWGDLQGSINRRPFHAFKRFAHDLFGDEPDEWADKSKEGVGNLYRQLGSLGHIVVPAYLSGKIPDYEALKNPADLPLPVPFAEHILPGNRVSNFLGEAIGHSWGVLVSLLRGEGDWSNRDAEIRRAEAELYRLLTPVFGRHLYALEAYRSRGQGAEYPCLLTAMSWATILSEAEYGGQRVFFQEAQLLNQRVPPSRKIGGGVLDAVEVIAIDGRRPSAVQLKTLSELARRRYPSIGHAVYAIVKRFGEGVLIRIIDWKFAVGDHPKKDGIIQPSDLFTPFPKHVRQIKAYMSLLTVSYALARGVSAREIWGNGGLIAGGQLVHVFPFSPMVSREIVLNQSEQEFTFVERVVTQIPKGEERAFLRTMNNRVVANVVQVLEGKGLSQRVVSSSNESGLLFSKEVMQALDVRSVTDQYRRFVDALEIIEAFGHRYYMHVDRLLVAIESGRINIERFDPMTGARISCLLHHDPGPSLDVYFGRGYWKCYGCGEWGWFMPRSVPAELQLTARSWTHRRIVREARRAGGFVVPEAHHRIMTVAQEILQSQFRGSAGERYLVGERALDSDLAFQLGAGHGSDHLITGLLDRGYTYDELIHYGFIALWVQRGRSTHRSLLALLERRGLKRDEIMRQIAVKPGVAAMALPNAVLNNRATFPLTLPTGEITNIYGRAVVPKIRAHGKLSIAHTGVAHGPFHAAVLNSKAPTIIVTEGVVDALTLMSLGFVDVVAMIAGNNVGIIEMIARTGKNIALALDRDPEENQTGQKNTLKITERINALALGNTVSNFTDEFAAAHPGDWKDFNQWWQRKRAIS